MNIPMKLVVIMVGCFLYGCYSPTYLSEAELQRYVRDADHGLRQKKQANELQITLQYRPTDLLVAQELNGSTSSAKVDSLRQKYGQYAYFVLSLSADKQDALYRSANYARFSEQLQTLAFRMGKYTQLVTSEEDTIPVSDFVFPRLYGYGSSTDVLFAFAREELAEDAWVQFDLQEFGMGTGSQKFRFRTEDWKKTPQIQFH
ncbi:hypothetical protein [Tunicatimonas pelagia]|uniref:hypothetical protein n=1 Tax=Tunicatimonas pelagia TaxID=931531 RepID=UPI0026651F6A|nr:hypothetical protein [Tunicatimonas pelagia]WKN45337.1 hypothetical protein P0M28_10235 [Tunicatimonas pelagia]